MTPTTGNPAPEEAATLTPLSKNERLKEGSNFLRGNLLHDLEDPSSGTVPEDSNQLAKFHGVYS